MRNNAEYWCLHLLKLFFNSVFDLNWCHWYWKFVWDYIFVVIENLPQFFLSFSEMLQWHSLWLSSLMGSSMLIHQKILPCHCFVLIVVAHAQGAGMFSHLFQPVFPDLLQGTYSSVGAILFHPQQYIFILFSLRLPTITWLIGWSKENFFTFCPLNS